MHLPLTLTFEQTLWKKNQVVAGVDEVGRGSLAGPVVAAAVVFPSSHTTIAHVYDSKHISPKLREYLCFEIINQAQAWGLGIVSVKEIHALGISKATALAMKYALLEVGRVDLSVIDGLLTKHIQAEVPGKVFTMVRGDSHVYSIASASIIAKVFRDQLMVYLHRLHPNYAWNKNKGYGTMTHRNALKLYGKTNLHRDLFVRRII